MSKDNGSAREKHRHPCPRRVERFRRSENRDEANNDIGCWAATQRALLTGRRKQAREDHQQVVKSKQRAQQHLRGAGERL